MSYNKSLATETESIVPYGSANGQTHIRFAGDYKTFCGRDCTHWTPTGTPANEVALSAYCCKRCKTEYFK